MKIQAVSYFVPKVNKNVDVKSAKSGSQPSFTGEYSLVYDYALTQSVRRYGESIDLYKKLAAAAKTEKGLFKGLYFRLLEGNVTEALKDARSSSYYTGDLLTSTAHEYPLVSMNCGEISFNHPKYGGFGGKITFWLSKNGELNLDRSKNYQKFYVYGGLKEYYEHITGGGMMNHVYYNRDGSKNFLKNFLFD